MNDQPQDQAPAVTANIQFGVGAWHIQTSVTVATGPIRLRQMLPLVQALSTAMVNAVTQDVEQKGQTVSCKKGCGACCRQLAPVSGVEARYLAELVQELPEPRRSEIQARFAAARQRLADSGLLEKMEHTDHWTEGDYKTLGMDYFRQGIACPFLEDESCSIHPQRPISCREYLVTSAAEHCAQPSSATIRTIALPFKMWWALARFEPPPADSRYVPWVPLILALAWAAEHADDDAARPGPELLAELFGKLTGKEAPPPI